MYPLAIIRSFECILISVTGIPTNAELKELRKTLPGVVGKKQGDEQCTHYMCTLRFRVCSYIHTRCF